MIVVKTPEDLVRMRAACRIAARVRDAVAQKVGPGVTTGELDAYAAELIGREGARSAFFGYRGSARQGPYPGHICLSVNEEVVHGIPGRRRIQIGDLVGVDVGVRYDGFIGDTARTVMVGVTDPNAIRLSRAAEKALAAGIGQAVTGRRVSDISHAIEQAAVGMGFSVVRELVGHGVGREMHEDPQVPNFGPPGRGARLRAGMTLALEPMVNMGTWEVDVLDDQWTVVTRDRQPSAHFEHTIAVGEEAAEILTPGDI